ncbi:hypothetical protein LCER1_G002071 [Lachnellula cervina]|uniref:DUF5672 domain-containing protein n=1 Tax=Lachnellula cervina TaxID=1316786 RepID=A0A7D8YVR8_9HELO|nr:hypothetical protein LCER1_G002071 [Lachnellula cervina]
MASSAGGDMTIDDAWEYIKTTGLTGWHKTTRRVRVAGAILLLCILCFFFLRPSIPDHPSLPTMPSISLEYNTQTTSRPTTPQNSPYNASKVALMIENRANPILAPLMLHFMSVVPPDWRFRFMGSLESVAFLNASRSIRNHIAAGKLDLTYIPANMTTGSQEEISAFLTTLWLYEVVLQPAEWLLIFQTDSMLCANSRQSLDSWLDYDWVGAPWNPNGRFGGNGGLSLRRVSSIIDVLRNQERRPGSEPEDVWLTDRLGHRPGAKLANGTASLTFSGEMFSGQAEKVAEAERKKKGKGKDKDKGNGKGKGKDPTKAGELVKGIDDWRDGFYEPMGYHTGGSGSTLHGGIWGTPEQRKHIWGYCPEVKIMLQMDAAKFVPGNCGGQWKRGEDAFDGFSGGGGETEVIDGEEYPMLPADLSPW